MRNVKSVFPEKGVAWPELEREMREVRKDDIKWRDGRMTMSIYFVNDELLELTRQAHGMFILENALFSGELAKRRGAGFASITKFESEVLAMALEILNGPEGAAGTLTSGGTESILLAVLGAREWARANRPEAKRPTLVLPRTAHPSFNKAAHLMGLAVTRVPQGIDFRADVAEMERAIDSDTILVAGSAPCYPFGVIDPIEELAELAKRRGVWFHVDACVGGFLAPFVRKLGHPVPEFDLGVPGVWSISADLHKYGFAAKGASVVLFRDAALKQYATFSFDDWPYGSYSTATIGGSRTGGAAAAAWAVMRNLGEEGYLEAARTIMTVRGRILDGIAAIGGLAVRGAPHVGLVSFGSDEFDINAVADRMKARGWASGRGKEPPSMHLTITPIHAESVERYLADLALSVCEVREGRAAAEGIEAVYAG